MIDSDVHKITKGFLKYIDEELNKEIEKIQQLYYERTGQKISFKKASKIYAKLK